MNATLVAPLAIDAAFPQRDQLLDPTYMGEMFAARLGLTGRLPITVCEQRRVTYSWGTSLRVCYDLQIADRRVMVAGRAFPAPNGAERATAVAARAASDAISVAGLQPILCDVAHAAVFWTSPNDRKIKHLSLLHDVPNAAACLLGGRWATSRIAAYAPEKSATGACLDDGGRTLAYAKVYAGCEAEQVAALYATLASDLPSVQPALALPRVVGVLAERGLLVLEAIDGPRIADLGPGESGAGMRRLGCALATLHELPPPALPSGSRLEPQALRAAACTLALARPDVAEAVHALADELLAHVPSPEPVVCLHGDVHPKNAVLTAGHVTLIDLDQATLGPAAVDLGSLLAALRYRASIGALPLAEAASLMDRFLYGYSEVRALPATATLAWYTAAALLAERALRAVSRVRGDGLRQLADIIADAFHVLHHGWR